MVARDNHDVVVKSFILVLVFLYLQAELGKCWLGNSMRLQMTKVERCCYIPLKQQQKEYQMGQREHLGKDLLSQAFYFATISPSSESEPGVEK